jgi:chaperonin cofactor prefoldin
MEDFLSQAISTGDIKIIIAAAIVYLIIYFQRNNTGKKRDEDTKLLQYRVEQLEKNHTELNTSIQELRQSIVDLQISINRLFERLDK